MKPSEPPALVQLRDERAAALREQNDRAERLLQLLDLLRRARP